MKKALIPTEKEVSGFVRKGKALVFTTVGDKTLSVEAAQEILEAGRAERDSRSFCARPEIDLEMDTPELAALVREGVESRHTKHKDGDIQKILAKVRFHP